MTLPTQLPVGDTNTQHVDTPLSDTGPLHLLEVSPLKRFKGSGIVIRGNKLRPLILPQIVAAKAAASSTSTSIMSRIPDCYTSRSTNRFPVKLSIVFCGMKGPPLNKKFRESPQDHREHQYTSTVKFTGGLIDFYRCNVAEGDILEEYQDSNPGSPLQEFSFLEVPRNGRQTVDGFTGDESPSTITTFENKRNGTAVSDDEEHLTDNLEDSKGEVVASNSEEAERDGETETQEIPSNS